MVGGDYTMLAQHGKGPGYSNRSLLFMMQLPPTHKGSYLVYGKLHIVLWVTEHLNYNLGIS